jgi:general secretion pathway protein I
MNRSRGFTLIEVVVAFAILSLASAAIYEAISTAATRSGRLNSMGPAISFAESLLAEHSVDVVYGTRNEEGVDGRLYWSVHQEPYLGGGAATGQPPVVEIDVKVLWDQVGGRAIELRRLASSHYENAK